MDDDGQKPAVTPEYRAVDTKRDCGWYRSPKYAGTPQQDVAGSGARVERNACVPFLVYECHRQ